MIVAGVAGCCY